jgi:hypothetical protein
MTTTKTCWSFKSWLRSADVIGGESNDQRCDWCHPADLYRDDRRWYEWPLAVLWLHPYVCCACKTRGLMFGRSYAYNWRWQQVRIRVIFRMAPTGSQRQRVSPQPCTPGCKPAVGIGVLNLPAPTPERILTLDVHNPSEVNFDLRRQVRLDEGLVEGGLIVGRPRVVICCDGDEELCLGLRGLQVRAIRRIDHESAAV